MPGGFVRTQEDVDLDHAARRVLDQKASLDAAYMEQVGSRGDATRDPRGWSVSVAYIALLGPDTASTFAFHPATDLPKLAFDHADIIAAAVARLRDKAAYSALPLHLLAPGFSINEARETYELLLGHRLDAANFRRKLLAQHSLDAAGRRQTIGPPTTTYRLRPDTDPLFRRPLVL